MVVFPILFTKLDPHDLVARNFNDYDLNKVVELAHTHELGTYGYTRCVPLFCYLPHRSHGGFLSDARFEA